MNLIKEKLLDMRQIEKLLLKFKKEKIPSDGGENLVNRSKKSEEENNDNNRSSDENEEEEPNSCGLHHHYCKISISELKHGQLNFRKCY